MSILEERLPYLETLELESGGHEAPNNGLVHACVMEAVAYVAGDPWSDHPECVSPVLGAFLRSWNDSLADVDRQMLKPLIPRLVGTKASKKVEEKRAWMATDWLARECAPAFLRLSGLTEHAEALEGLAALTTTQRAKKAQPTLAAAGAAAWDAARAAARAAAWAAAWAAARDAARDAAWAAARDAAWDAAWAAAGDAAWAAAWAAARDAARAAARAAAADAAGAAAGAAARDAAGGAAWAAAWAAARDAARDAAWAAAADAARAAAGAAARDAAGDAAWAALEPTVKQLQASALLLIDRMIDAS